MSRRRGSQRSARKYRPADGTESERTRLEVHLDRYTAKNTFDYFIHKDLGGFLRRELDFYIKNEVMHLDDIEHDDAPRVETVPRQDQSASARSPARSSTSSPSSRTSRRSCG